MTRRSEYLEALRISKKLKLKHIKGYKLKKKWTSKGSTEDFFKDEIERLMKLNGRDIIKPIIEQTPEFKPIIEQTPAFKLESPAARKGDIKTIRQLAKKRRTRRQRVGLVKPPKRRFIRGRRMFIRGRRPFIRGRIPLEELEELEEL